MKITGKYAVIASWCLVAIFHLTPCAQAAELTTPLFPTADYHFSSLSYLLEKNDSNTTPVISWQTKTNRDDPDAWQILDEQDLLCQKEKQQLFCQLPLNINWLSWGQLKIVYADDAALKFFNLQKQEPEQLVQTIDANHHEHYSSLKTFSQQGEFRSLGWQTLDLVPEASSATLIQYRSTYDGQRWSDWQSNYQLQALNDEQYQLTTPKILTADIDAEWLLLNYRDQKSKRQAAQAFATGSNETEAFLSRTLVINQLDDLQIGQTIIISEQVGDSLFAVETIIADINQQTHEITTYPFYGSIPQQNPQICGSNHHYCFSKQATIYPVKNSLVALKNGQAVLPVSINLADLLAVWSLKDNLASSNTLALNLRADKQQRLPTLQYRLLLPELSDRLVKEVYLLADHHQETATQATTKGRLRGGKNFASGMGKPSVWQ